MGAFDIVDIIIDVILIVSGILGVACPKLFVKREERDNPESLKKARILGVLELVFGVVFIIVALV